MSRWNSTRKCSDEPITIQIPSLEIEKSSDKDVSMLPVTGNKLYFYSEVNRESVYILSRQIDELNKHLRLIQFSYDLEEPPPIHLYVSSEGGEVFSALSVMDKISKNVIPIHTHCEGLVASAATYMTVVGRRRTISPNAVMLIHQVSSSLWGNYQEFKDEVQNLDLIMNFMRNIYFKYTKFTEHDLEELLKHDLCLRPEKCLELGLVDSIE